MPSDSFPIRAAARRNLVSRRRLMTTGSIGVAGLVLTGCGGDDAKSTLSSIATPTAGAGATATVADPFAGAKHGGTLTLSLTGDPPTIDPFANTSFQTKTHAAHVYSRLFRYKCGPGIAPSEAKPQPDLAASAETSPDGLTWTIKLRPGVKFHDVAPVSGREVTSDDVRFSYGRALDPKNNNSTQFSFVDKVAYPDKSTVVFTLKAPNVTFLDFLADTNYLFVLPTESDGGFNPATTSIGSGPWLFDSYSVSVALKYRRNPNWYENGFPLVDRLDYVIIPSYPNRLAQFQSGSLDAVGPQNDDLANLKKQLPDTQLFGSVAAGMSFLYFDTDPASPWVKDERVRQAVSMALDRDGLTDLAYDTKKLKAAGLDAKSPWNNVIPAGMTQFWLDPQSAAQGETAKFFKYDPKGARELLSAAGVADNFSVTYQYAGNQYGAAFNAIAEAQIAMLKDIGLNVNAEVQDYNSKYIPQTARGNFKGIAFGPETSFPGPEGFVNRMFTDNISNKSRVSNDQDILKLIGAQQREADEAKRKEMFAEIQRVNAKHMYYAPSQFGAGTTFSAYQPSVRNALTYQTRGYGAGAETVPYYWRA